MQVSNSSQRFVIYDLEYTAWPHSQERKWTDPGEHREVVHIGAVIADCAFIEIDSVSVYVKPRINPLLSDFFTQLTGIHQDTIEREGLTFQEAFANFFTWTQGLPLFSWGRSDDAVLKENCELESMQLSFSDDRFHNMRDVFIKGGVNAQAYNSSTILRAFGKQSAHPAHNGLGDARTVLDALRELPHADEHILSVLNGHI